MRESSTIKAYFAAIRFVPDGPDPSPHLFVINPCLAISQKPGPSQAILGIRMPKMAELRGRGGTDRGLLWGHWALVAHVRDHFPVPVGVLFPNGQILAPE